MRPASGGAGAGVDFGAAYAVAAQKVKIRKAVNRSTWALDSVGFRTGRLRIFCISGDISFSVSRFGREVDGTAPSGISLGHDAVFQTRRRETKLTRSLLHEFKIAQGAVADKDSVGHFSIHVTSSDKHLITHQLYGVNNCG
jgi:hypothetical protein